MQFHFFHLMPYTHLDLAEAAKYKSVWVDFPNSNFDPVKGFEVYNRFLDELEYAEELGFDGVCVNEHHQNAYGLMPSPIVPAAALARRTKWVRIAILGSAFNLREHPLTLAEEHAMLDCITGGRLVSGMVRGIGCEFFTMGVNPTTSLERFHEAHDLVVRSWTEPGPFAFEGKHYHFEYVNVWPRPYQKPHPPIWCPSLGSMETIEWAAHPSRKYTYLQTYSPFKAVSRYLNAYRRQCESYGYSPTGGQVGWAAPIYVAATDEQAKREIAPHVETFFNKLIRNPLERLMPPGYLSMRSLKAVRQHKSGLGKTQTIDSLMDDEVIVVGSPATVIKKLTGYHRQTGLGHLLAMLQIGTLPADLTRRSTELFAREVIPALRPLSDREYEPPEEAVAAQ
ncbi:MAG: LLM class flavin-dependent oxidoreductase [Alphaproteobacteria bacterium]|nr:LLM class flavin-dependent oxidoreductase [Alphaproteobacteria bacterium]